MKKKSILRMALLTILNLSLSLNLKSQVAVNTNGADANSAAMLDVSSTSKGILIPRMTLSQRNDISNPVTGLMIFQTDNTSGFYFYNGTTWVVVGTEATTINSLNDGVSDGSSVFLGDGAGENDDGTNNNNTGTGIYSLKEVTSGDYNSAFGTEALKVVTTGTYNAGFGRASLFSNVSGQHNTAIGSNAGYFVTGSDNILIGYNVAFNETSINNKLFIENSASSTPLIYGEFDNDLLRINGTLDINNAYQLPTTDGTNGQTLKTNGSGSLSWADDSNTGATNIDELTDGKTDSFSLFLGNGAGALDDGSDNRNTAVGVNSLNSSVDSYANTAFGNEALKLTTTGTHNTVVGSQALTNNLVGIENTALGTNAGFNVTGSGNVFLGCNVAFSETAISNKLYIDNSSTGTPLIFGDFNTNLLRINGTLDINNAYQLPTSDGTSGQTLKTDGSGSLIWADDTNTGATSINELSDASTDYNSLFLGIGAGGNDDGTTNFNTGTGVWSLKEVTSGSHNSAFGTTALQLLTTGSQNTALGMGALNSVTTNSNNTAIGKDAGKDVTGSGNVFIGNEVASTQTNINNKLYIDNSDTIAPLIYGDFEYNTVRINHNLELGSDSTGSSLKLLEPDTAGIHYTVLKTQPQDTSITYILPEQKGIADMVLKYGNGDTLVWDYDGGASCIDDLDDAKTDGSSVFLGNDAGEDDDGNNFSTSVGIGSLANNTSGQKNTAIGSFSMNINTTGYSNVSIGSDALKNNTSGLYNTAIGVEALLNNSAGGSNTAIGIYSLRANNTGGNNTAIGNEALMYGSNGIRNTAVGANSGFTSTSYDHIQTGAFGYGAKVTASNQYRIGSYGTTSIGGQVGWSTYSDGRFKRNVKENIPGLEFILKLKPVSYNWDIRKLEDYVGATEETDSCAHTRDARSKQEAKTYTGFIAQEVEKVAQNIGYDFSGVETPPNDFTPYSIRYAEFVVPLVKAVQEQQEMIEVLQKQNEMLIERLEKLENGR